jgi:hypothetical protein
VDVMEIMYVNEIGEKVVYMHVMTVVVIIMVFVVLEETRIF